jgi:N6-L-threonylcarbamoyladenine synthase
MSVYILGIESSCDDTSAAIVKDNNLLANVIANQDIHSKYGGVVPEYASRAHQQNIIPVIEHALKIAKISKKSINAIAFTRGPGLLGSLLVGTSFSKAFAMGMNIPLIEVDHIQAHILAHFIKKEGLDSSSPEFPFLCLVVSGGHTMIMLVKDYFDMDIIGQTIDDAAGEAFDKAAKIMDLPYPGGVLVDQYANDGDQKKFKFPVPKIKGLDFSFSGLKTSFLYLVRDHLKENSNFVKENLNDLCASIQFSIVDILMTKIAAASKITGIKSIAIAGGVSANSYLRKRLEESQELNGWKVYIPKLEYSTDNAAMVAIAGYYKFKNGKFSEQNISPYTKYKK